MVAAGFVVCWHCLTFIYMLCLSSMSSFQTIALKRGLERKKEQIQGSQQNIIYPSNWNGYVNPLGHKHKPCCHYGISRGITITTKLACNLQQFSEFYSVCRLETLYPCSLPGQILPLSLLPQKSLECSESCVGRDPFSHSSPLHTMKEPCTPRYRNSNPESPPAIMPMCSR